MGDGWVRVGDDMDGFLVVGHGKRLISSKATAHLECFELHNTDTVPTLVKVTWAKVDSDFWDGCPWYNLAVGVFIGFDIDLQSGVFSLPLVGEWSTRRKSVGVEKLMRDFRKKLGIPDPIDDLAELIEEATA